VSSPIAPSAVEPAHGELAAATGPKIAEPPVSATTTPEAAELEPLGSLSDAPVTSLESGPPGVPEPPAGPPPSRAETPEEAVLREALKLMDDLAGVKAAMAMLAEQGQAPPAAAGASSHQPDSAQRAPTHSPEPSPPPGGSAPSGTAGAASSGTGSAALYALVIALAALAGGLWGRLLEVPVRWRSVTIVALNERPG